jgi:CBS domain containing-hemolysin-like protein
VRSLGLRRVETVALEPVDMVRADDRPRDTGARRALVVDDTGRPQRWLLPTSDHPAAGAPDRIAVVRSDQTLHDALDAMLRAGDDVAAVTDESGQAIGLLPWTAVIRENHANIDPAATTAEPAHLAREH